MIIFQQNTILQNLHGRDRIWTVPELLECYEPLDGEPLAVRLQAMQQAVFWGEELYSDLSEAAQLRYHFWKQLRPERIEERKYEYSVTIRDTYRWELTVNSKGLFYKDLTPMYGQQPGQVYEQLFSDFWFYGPLMPIPDLDDRKWAVSQIRNAFLQIGPVSQKHFELFEYPKLPIDRFWEEGDHNAKDFVNMRYFGIEAGRTNWHDGLVYISFISFERLLADPKPLERLISPAIQAEISGHLSDRHKKQPREEPDPTKARMKQMYMENGGMHHYILREHGDSYVPNPVDEFIWRRELLDKMTQRLETIDHYSGLNYIAAVMRYHGVPDVEEQFLKAAATPNLKARQAIAQVLDEQFQSEKAVDVLRSLLQFENEESYWRDYVFSSFGRMRQNRAVQRFIIQCLRGDHEIHFKKAVDVLVLWGMKGDTALMDRQLLLSLKWEDACAADPDFNQSLSKVIRIIES
ncbi:MAG: hypothetical protein H6577_21130 [Lewinellaceae bacterium]|nr:hypothetical protein [Lewinellaceae bacterium]